jgi:hypothetical protein
VPHPALAATATSAAACGGDAPTLPCAVPLAATTRSAAAATDLKKDLYLNRTQLLCCGDTVQINLIYFR